MEPVFTVEHGNEPPVVPPAPHHGPGQMEGQGRGLRVGGGGGARPVVALLLFLGVTVGFAFGVYHARHSGSDLAFAIVTYYLFVVLACCVAKLRQLRRDPAATAAERRRVRIGAWCISVALGTTVTSRVADAMPGLALKLVVWGVSVVLHGLGLYFLFLRKGAERCDAEELRCGQADAARPPATALHGGLSPEEKV
jgi:uncharacterized membrane protein YfcA